MILRQARNKAAHVPPNLPLRMHEPVGFEWGSFTTSDGAELRWGRLSPAGAWLDCVLVGGFCEFIEKYFELIQDFGDRGIAVTCLDWRGQGGSQRPTVAPNRPRRRDFDRDAADLKAFTDLFVKRHRSRVVVAHSMGGAIALKAMAQHPQLFDAAVLSAPMFAVATGIFHRSAAEFIAFSMDSLGFERVFIPGISLIDAEKATLPENCPTSHDPVRGNLMSAWFDVRPDLRLDGTTFGWYRGALNVSREFSGETLPRQVSSPLLIGMAGDDRFVDNQAIHRVAQWLPHGTLAEFPTARHELFHECDDIRNEWLIAIESFFRKYAGEPPR